ncbi:hypothetical protein L9W97_07335 [Vibrio aestuarianus]|uniref:NACHT domain-containing protein n=1 Tax=Vibrio aestuarianus TaxID=28171 RepID=UPI00237CF244|nr:hypothetical protein [Vibrio aestuarianus]MDE1324939.1 hypothetical protein [Vibrio aestuarianus]
MHTAKKTGGGTAVGSGMNFQASVTAIVGVHILRGIPLDWLGHACEDIPTGVWAESEGPGDDLRIELFDDTAIEVQVKKGLQRGNKLWTALIDMAKAIQNDGLPYGVLVVSTDSSNSICQDLAKDIIRIGEGRLDLLSDIGADWVKKLEENEIEGQEVCRRLRIKVIHSQYSDDASVNNAKDSLRFVCKLERDINTAWTHLHSCALALIERRGRWTVHNLIDLFQRNNISIRQGDFIGSLFQRYNEWIIKANSSFHITGTNSLIPISELIPMSLKIYDHKAFSDAKSALEHYTRGYESYRFSEQLDAKWAARFKKQVVVIAGPGLGKTTLLKQLAHQYAEDGYMVLKVALKNIALGMKNGSTFSESLLSHAVDSSPLTPENIRFLSSTKSVVLADGLDECGTFHNVLAEQLNKYAIANPDTRIIVTTRPIGYETKELLNWRHYSLLPPNKDLGKKNLTTLVDTLRKHHFTDKTENTPYISQPNEVISVSPLMLGMSASLYNNYKNLPESKRKLYTALFNLFENKITLEQESCPYNDIVLDLVGWNLIENPLVTYKQLVKRISDQLSTLTGKSSLDLQGNVKAAISQWERAGLVEKVYFEGTALLTFIHKTFCEFAASRYLAEHGIDQLESVLLNKSMKEVIDFSLGHGLSEPLISLYITRHNDGEPYQLTQALELLSIQDITVSIECKKELIECAFKAIDQGVEDKLSIGKALSALAPRYPELVKDYADSRLNVSDAGVKLIMYAITLQCSSANYDALALANLLEDFLSILTTRSILDIVHRRDHSNIELVQSIALIALNAQSDNDALPFAKHIMENQKIDTFDFRYKINHALRVRNIDELPEATTITRDTVQSAFSEANLLPREGVFKCRSTRAITLIARALSNRSTTKFNSDCKNRSLLQFSGFLTGSSFMKVGLNDDIFYAEHNDEDNLRSIICTISDLLPLEKNELERDATYILDQIDQENSDFGILSFPRVDICEPKWEEASTLSIDLDEITQGFVHSSSWINYLTCGICQNLDIPLDMIDKLLHNSYGFPLRCVLELLNEKYPEKVVSTLHHRLNTNTDGDISPVLDMLSIREEKQPSPKIVENTAKCLYSGDKNTVVSASNLIAHYVDLGVQIESSLIKEAIKHWNGEWEIDESLKLLLSKVTSIT